MKEGIVLAQHTGVSEFTFLLNTDGLNLYHTPEDRYYLARTEEAEMKIWLGNIEIFDAAAKPSMGTLTVETVTAGQQYRLTISADVDFLTDPDTVYPVTIDPTITVSDNTYGANAIEDAPIYEGYPTSNFGTYQYNRAGYAGTAYGRGRTVVRLNGLLNDSNYASASEYNISSVIFYIAEASGTAAATVTLHPLISNSTWTESNITWINKGTYVSTPYASNSLSYGAYASFNITALARLWKNGTRNGNCGFVLMGANESTVDKSMYSSEHSTSSMRPYVVATYNENLDSTYIADPYINDFDDTYDFPGSESIMAARIYDNALQLRANCYGYALRVYYDGDIENAGNNFTTMNGLPCKYLSQDNTPIDPQCYKQQPGEFAEKPLTITTNGMSVTIDSNAGISGQRDLMRTNAGDDGEINLLAELIKADAAAMGFPCEVLAEGSVAPDASLLASQGMRLIALVLKGGSFHFYMQHSDNSWSHKNGEGAPSNYCLNNCGRLSSNSVFKNHALEDAWSGGEIRYIKIGKSADVDWGHSNGRAATQTTLSAHSNAKAVGDTLGSATDLGTVLPASFTGLFNCSWDSDFFCFRPNTSKTVIFSINESGATYTVKLFNQNGTQLYSTGMQTGPVSFTYAVSYNSQYYLSIYATYASPYDPVEYTLTIS